MSAADHIAVTGLACRLPGASDPDTFLANLAAARSAIGPLPADRWALDDHYDADPRAPGKISTRQAGTIDGVDLFDRRLFAMSPHEARASDPQHRLLLEVAWEALEAAGEAPARLAGAPVGVFVGISSVDYWLLQAKAGYPAAANPYVATGGSLSVAAGRIAYCLGLTGPAIAVDTACSSALTALTLACESLLRGETPMALAGGVNLILSPDVMAALCRMGVIARDGPPNPFGADADGFARGEGCVVLVLKRLEQARADGDTVHAVIRGWAVNQDGRTNGLSAPSREAQANVMRAALARAGVVSGDVGFVEAHGSATLLGDAIEAGALADAYGPRAPAAPLRIGAVKAAVGHLEAAAGLAGLLKALLMVRDGVLPAQPNFSERSPRIPWDELPVAVQARTEEWPGPDRIAGVHATGFSGTNVHVIVARDTAPSPPAAMVSGPVMVPLSAATPGALAARARALGALLAASPELPLAAVANRAARAWTGLACADAIVAADNGEAARELDALAARAVERPARRGKALRRVALTSGDVADGAAAHAALAAAFGPFPPEADTLRAAMVILCEAAGLAVVAPGEAADIALHVGAAPCGNTPGGGEPVRALADDLPPVQSVLLAFAELLRRGAAVDARGLCPHGPVAPLALPPYPFERERYWFTDG